MKFKNLTEYLDSLVHEKNTPCVDCIVYKNHEMVYRHFAGKSDLEANKVIKGDELYFIFSLTKIVTCMAALLLYEKGKFGLDDPISKYMPEFEKMKITADTPQTDNIAKITTGHNIGGADIHTGSGYAKNKITVRHLFTMSAGFDYSIEAPHIKNALAVGKTGTRDLMSAMADAVLGFEPGTRFNYSLCHDVLGALIEVWSGELLGDYARKNIFEPLGLKNTFFGTPNEEQKLKMAARYVFNDQGKAERLPLENPYNLSPDYQSGGAGLNSTTEDYALILDALACGGVGKTGNRILLEDTVKLMHTDQLNGMDGPFEGYGYGLGVRVHKNPNLSGSLSPIGEFGWDGAAGCFAMVDPKTHISLTHFEHIHAWDLAQRNGLRNALYNDLHL